MENAMSSERQSANAKPFDLSAVSPGGREMSAVSPGRRDFAFAEFLAASSDLKVASQGAFKKAICAKLAQVRDCELVIQEGPERLRFGQRDHDTQSNSPALLRAHIRILNPQMWTATATNGSVGIAESFMDGHWVVDDVVSLIRIFVRNRDVLDRMEGGLARFGQWLLKVWHQKRRNTEAGSKRNIAEHYDLSNALFKTFLDPTMMYSSAIFKSADEDLNVAAVRKLDRICQKLDLQPSDHLLEIGTGWGGFALHAAKHYGCKITTTTISEEQYQLASARVAEAGLSDRITLLQQDYRALEGSFDKVVSIEMIEAIGHQYLNTYFGKIASLLKPNGLALIQAITIEDSRYAQALKEVDFIKRYIFPGSFIPSITAMLGACTAASDMKLIHLEDIGPSYAHTLKAWRERFNAALDEVKKLGFDDRFIRMWNFYLAYCEGGFIERSIGDVHLLLAKPRNQRHQYLPDLNPSV
jgi:cyclopropane-fatty-acyl-phospholipid synthase